MLAIFNQHKTDYERQIKHYHDKKQKPPKEILECYALTLECIYYLSNP